MADRARIPEQVATALEPLSALTGVREGSGCHSRPIRCEGSTT